MTQKRNTSVAFMPATPASGKVYNHAQKHCPGCKHSRSAGQFKGDSAYCNTCVLRGRDKA